MMFAHIPVRLSWAYGSDESKQIRFGHYDTGYYTAQFQKDRDGSKWYPTPCTLTAMP
jgi:hypothetical protein